MNKDFYTGMFFGGIIAFLISGILMLFKLEGLSILIWIILLDIIMFINICYDKLKSKRRRKK